MYLIIGADGREYGPASEEQLRRWIGEGRANAQTRVRQETAGAPWQTLGSLPEFAPLFAPAPPPVPMPLGSVEASPTGLRTNGMAIAGLVLGAISLSTCFCCAGMPLNLLGLIFSILALSQINADPQHQAGRGLAIAGLVLSSLSLLMGMGVFGLQLLDRPHLVHWHMRPF